MYANVLALACLACTGLARKVQAPSGEQSQFDRSSRIPGTSKVLAELLLTRSPAAGWQVTGAGPSPIFRYDTSQLASPAAHPTSASAAAAQHPLPTKTHAASPVGRRTSASPNLLVDATAPVTRNWQDVAGDVGTYALLAGILSLTVYAIFVTLKDTGEEYGQWRKPEPDDDDLDDLIQSRALKFNPETGQWEEKRVRPVAVRPEVKKAKIGRVSKEDEPELNRYQKRMLKKRKQAARTKKNAARRENNVQMMLGDTFDDTTGHVWHN